MQHLLTPFHTQPEGFDTLRSTRRSFSPRIVLTSVAAFKILIFRNNAIEERIIESKADQGREKPAIP